MLVQSVLGLHSLKTSQYRFHTTKEWLREKTKDLALIETRQQYKTRCSSVLYGILRPINPNIVGIQDVKINGHRTR